MEKEFISQVFPNTDGDYDLLVLTDGDVIVPVRLNHGAAHIQTGRIAVRDNRDGEGLETIIERVKESVEGDWTEEGRVYTV